MIPDGTHRAVVDRIEDGLATLEVETEDGALDELVVDAAHLPEPARHADAILQVDVQDGDLVDVTYDAAATEDRREEAQDRFDRLSDRLSRDDE